MTACGGGDGGEGSGGRLRIVAAFYPLADAAEHIADDRATVVNITPAGTEPHDIELTADQVDDLEDADLVLYAGGGFQPAVEEIADRRDGGSLDLLKTVGASGDDPHFWLDPTTFSDAVTAIADALGKLDASSSAAYAANAAEFAESLTALDAEFTTGLETCERRTFITAHDAFGFLADRYDLEQLSISGLAPESEPDPDRLDELANVIERSGITTVFYEDLVAPDVAETLAREMGVDTAVLSPIEGLTPEQAAGGQDYLSVMRSNLAALRKALGCT